MTTEENDDVKKSRRGLQQYSTNPFISTAVVSSRTKRVTNKRGDMMMISSDGSGEIIAPVAGFWQAEEIDSTKFVKLYINGVKAFKGLKNPGTAVFEILYLKVQESIGKDVIWLTYSEVDQALTPISKATFMRGMRELLEKGFIAESTTQSKYFLNPDFVWNGDRLAFIKEYRRAPAIGAPKDLNMYDEISDEELTERLLNHIRMCAEIEKPGYTDVLADYEAGKGLTSSIEYILGRNEYQDLINLIKSNYREKQEYDKRLPDAFKKPL